MSAIVGIHNLDGRPVASADLSRMVEAMAFRGPDGSEIWNEGPAGLGHLMLHTTPESLHETLPLIDKTRDLALTADARIDNRDELSEALGLSAEVSRGMSDSEFVLAAYIEWGEECPKHLIGDFAFAIWDGQQQKLFCARDHFGVKAFYYFHALGRFFAFATEIKAILTLEGVPRGCNENRIADHLTGLSRNSTDTFYAEIFRLAPAHSMSLSASGLKMERYWALDITRKTTLGSDAEYAQKFRGIFEEAVRCRMRSCAPLGTMLSGGMDSSSITCMARHLNPPGSAPLPTFSAVFDVVKACDERAYIKPVLDQGGYDSTFMVADMVSPLHDVDRISYHQDEVLSAPNLYLNWEIYKKAQEKGVRVILDGFDGDSTVSHGNGYLVELATAHRWRKLRSEVMAFSEKLGESGNKAFRIWLNLYGWQPFVEKHFLLRGARKFGRQVWRIVKRKSRTTASVETHSQELINPDFARRTAQTVEDGITAEYGIERKIHLEGLVDKLISNTLEVLDRASNAFSIEIRFPFWDIRLAEFCLSLPPEQKLQGGWSRLVMRRGAEGILPPEVQWRPAKTNMAPGFDYNMTKFDRAKIDEILGDDLTRIEGYVNVMVVKSAHSRYQTGVASAEDLMHIWRAASLAFWLNNQGATS